MKRLFTVWLIRILIGSVFFGGVAPVLDGPLYAQSSKKKKKKKSSSKKKKSSKKKASKKKKTGKAKKKKKKRPSKKKKAKKKTRKKKAAPKKQTLDRERPAKMDVTEFADELYTITEALNVSSDQLTRATSYLKGPQERRLVRLDSREAFTTADYEKAADKEPQNVRLQRQLGLHYESVQEFERAKDVYLRLLVNEPLNPDYHYFLGSLYARVGALGKAQQSFEEALDLKPDHYQTLNAMASFLGTRHGKSMSSEVLSRSAAKHPDGPAQKMTAIRDKLKSGEAQEAIMLAKSAAEQHPSHSGFIYLQGQGYEELGEIDAAKSSYQKAIHMDSKNKESHMALANLYYNQGKYVYSALGYSDVVYLDPYNVDARYMQGLSYFNASEWGRAANAWEDLLHYDPHHPLVRMLLPQAYYVLAVEYNRIGKSAQGRSSFDKAMSINSNTRAWLSGAMRTLGKTYRERGMYKESLAAFQEVVELKPADSKAYLGMGITYWKMQETQLAKAAWNRSLELSPDDNEAKGWLIIAHQAGS
ncbi:MAG: tetratricopeptide repeat protein [Candidatus Marinimicrobia bacterium]|jgi:tetratricopeptide (TPR) repeat protein|nr:tetratricopeptide repeat protein [Candidatus Neomarinimicrobiota bacterium]MDP7072707.1 tetratricopeptide repeat protein [Candidatus Neomarinimicrobiota bacterium]